MVRVYSLTGAVNWSNRHKGATYVCHRSDGKTLQTASLVKATKFYKEVEDVQHSTESPSKD